jgi:hypothetical protein
VQDGEFDIGDAHRQVPALIPYISFITHPKQSYNTSLLPNSIIIFVDYE